MRKKDRQVGRRRKRETKRQSEEERQTGRLKAVEFVCPSKVLFTRFFYLFKRTYR